ncbi:MAG: methyltransferase domain-containing protein [Elusimicrobia bacterium]|nr:methyltransferase domain-containing protein [Elusimicrobiota bacterium]
MLVTGAGAGNDLPFLIRALEGKGEIFAQDIAKEMILVGISRYKNDFPRSDVNVYFSVSDATTLPFLDDFFDSAYHFGGINLFSNIKRGIAEMNRVVKAEGRVVIGDEGLAPWLTRTEYGEMLVKNNPLYSCAPPLSAIPETARAVNLSWELGNCYYIIEFQVSKTPLSINIDIPHKGKRGGTLRTRYYGQLEGVDPNLRDRIYAEAERQGVSRVNFLESILRASLRGD